MKFVQASLSLALLLAAAGPLAAQEIVASYYAALGAQDYHNSRGARLGNFAAVIQQDRANFHRFGWRDPQDEGDPIFGSREMRSRIPELFDAGDNGWWTRQPLRVPTGRPLDAEVLVFICATRGRISYIIVDHANGDGHRGC
ncbi:hypothetical protein [Thetidibacter halocola]|uniref:Uncharacterized protein n=1 Tax=Thetidibacter halocola TaxID=2827239 RepID=A0A8J8B6W1_9RHOB|nr:hypothetical protein [Thetidibacter halocola]MBS0123767.1 hypothetical protein [Thetidibacter halocola]